MFTYCIPGLKALALGKPAVTVSLESADFGSDLTPDISVFFPGGT